MYFLTSKRQCDHVTVRTRLSFFFKYINKIICIRDDRIDSDQNAVTTFSPPPSINDTNTQSYHDDYCGKTRLSNGFKNRTTSVSSPSPTVTLHPAGATAFFRKSRRKPANAPFVSRNIFEHQQLLRKWGSILKKGEKRQIRMKTAQPVKSAQFVHVLSNSVHFTHTGAGSNGDPRTPYPE